MIIFFSEHIQTICTIVLTIGLITLAIIDLKSQLLPDSITLPLLWLGLLISLISVFTTPTDAILGAVIGYFALWAITVVFKWMTGRVGMGNGDFKLLAALGAWLGWQQLPFIILFSSLLGSIIGLCLILFKKQTVHSPIPFGPFLATAGWISLLWGGQITQWYWQMI